MGTFSDPSFFADNIVWQNRQFFFYVDATSGCTPGDVSCTSTYGLCPDVSDGLNCPGGNTVVYNDLGVIGAVGSLACAPGTSCILTGVDPLFVSEYANGDKSAVLQQEATIQTPAAFDEGGNFIRPRFGPLSLYIDGNPETPFGDYHIEGDSPAINAGTDLTGTYNALGQDYDGESRPFQGGVDIGADEVH